MLFLGDHLFITYATYSDKSQNNMQSSHAAVQTARKPEC